VKQKTAKTVLDVLNWIENTQHHYAAWDEEPGFFILKGRHFKLRVPEALQAETRNFVHPSPEAFDTRMFRANKKGKALIRKLTKKEAN